MNFRRKGTGRNEYWTSRIRARREAGWDYTLIVKRAGQCCTGASLGDEPERVKGGYAKKVIDKNNFLLTSPCSRGVPVKYLLAVRRPSCACFGLISRFYIIDSCHFRYISLSRRVFLGKHGVYGRNFSSPDVSLRHQDGTTCFLPRKRLFFIGCVSCVSRF